MFSYKSVDVSNNEFLIIKNVDTGSVAIVPVSVLFSLIKSFECYDEVVADDVQKSK